MRSNRLSQSKYFTQKFFIFFSCIV